jgi:hypothetical protein
MNGFPEKHQLYSTNVVHTGGGTDARSRLQDIGTIFVHPLFRMRSRGAPTLA